MLSEPLHYNVASSNLDARSFAGKWERSMEWPSAKLLSSKELEKRIRRHADTRLVRLISPPVAAPFHVRSLAEMLSDVAKML